MGSISINSTDRLFATVSRYGSAPTDIVIVGATCFKDVVARLRDTFSAGSGLVSLTLRNSTKGWTRSTALLF